ncbi:hypothetical protein EJ110_NYTH02450 [Nymphaea thermarum]|nr:hypothetical protein EJ110_NYTH02450 [Nymphaea thermarum]
MMKMKSIVFVDNITGQVADSVIKTAFGQFDVKFSIVGWDDRKISCLRLKRSDPDFEVAKRLKQLVKKHEAEVLHFAQLEEEVRRLPRNKRRHWIVQWMTVPFSGWLSARA